jgi:hypothetical protein
MGRVPPFCKGEHMGSRISEEAIILPPIILSGEKAGIWRTLEATTGLPREELLFRIIQLGMHRGAWDDEGSSVIVLKNAEYHGSVLGISASDLLHHVVREDVLAVASEDDMKAVILFVSLKHLGKPLDLKTVGSLNEVNTAGPS